MSLFRHTRTIFYFHSCCLLHHPWLHIGFQVEQTNSAFRFILKKLRQIFFYRKQGGKSCAKARRAFAEKFGRKSEALKYAILSRFHGLSRFTHFLKDFGQKRLLVKYCVYWARSALLHDSELNLQLCNSVQKRINTKKRINGSFYRTLLTWRLDST